MIAGSLIGLVVVGIAKIVNFTEVAHYEGDVFHLENH
jgi:hypothetical protein